MRQYRVVLENLESGNIIEFNGVDLDKVKSYLDSKYFDNEYKNISSIRPSVIYRTTKKNKRLKN